MLKYEEKTIKIVDYSDLEELIKEVYGHDFEIVADLETGNDTYHNFDVESGNSKYDGDQETVEKFIETGNYGYYSTGAILNDLCEKGHLPEGEYLIHISW